MVTRVSAAAVSASGATVLPANTPCTAVVAGQHGHDRPSLEVLCAAGGTRVSFTTALGDLRTWAAGTIRPADHVVGYTVVQSGKPTCFASFHPTPIDFSLDSAKGEPAPAPPLVTADFHRTYRVSMHRTVSVGLPHDVCLERVDVTLELEVQFEQTAADYQYNPNGPCACPV
jgi:hypothetical protein